MALRTEVLIPAGPQHHQKQAAPFDLHAFHYYFSGIWKQRLLFHRTQPENARAALLLPPNIPSEKCLPWFTKCAEEPLPSTYASSPSFKSTGPGLKETSIPVGIRRRQVREEPKT